MATKKNNNNNNKTFPKVYKIFLSGLAGGLLVLGGNFVVQKIGDNQEQSSAASSSSSGKSLVAPKISGETDSTKAYERIKPAVVSVINMEEYRGEMTPVSGGTGVVYTVDGDDAYIITNNHVVEGAEKLQVDLIDGTQLEASVVGTDIMTDLAVLKVSSENISVSAEFGDSDQVKVGETVIAVGSPLGEEFASSVSQGIISASKRLVDFDSGGYGGSIVMQTDAAINPGNSGGPLVNLAGQVVGINSMKVSGDPTTGISVEGMGFAIPSRIVVEIANGLINSGEIVRPSLGVTLTDLTDISIEEQEENLKLPEKIVNGVAVITINPGSPAADAGLQVYDVIVEIDGKATNTQAELREILYTHQMGDTIKISYYRGDSKKTAEIKLDEKLEIKKDRD